MLEGKKISELDQIDTLSLGSSFPVLDKGATKRIAFSALLNKIENELPESDIDKVKDDVEKLKVKTESINTLTTEMEAVKDQVSGVDEMVQGQNATIRNCVSAVEDLEQVIEQTHFDDVLALEEQVRANTSGIAQNAANIELKQNLLNENQLKAINSGITAELVAKIGDVSALENSNLPIGAPMAWLSEVPPVGFLAFDGSEYNQEDFPELYEVVKNIPSFHSDTEGKFKIPNLKGRVLQGADTVIGKLIEAGLPNIKGKLAYNKLADAIIKEEGALFNGKGSNNFTNGGGIGGQQYAICLDASKGETKTDGTLKTQYEPHVYGNSDTVQMDAFTVYWVIKATNYVSLEKNAIDGTKTTKANAWSAEKTKAEIETVDNKFNFSTDEIIVGKWIDGKPIYRKVFLDPNNSWGAQDNIIGNITNFKEPTSIKAIAFNDTGLNGWVENNEGGESCCSAYIKSNGEVHFYRNDIRDGVAYPKKVIIEYTKTTD